STTCATTRNTASRHRESDANMPAPERRPSGEDICAGVALSALVRLDVGGELVERHRPAGCARGVSGNADVGHDHPGAAVHHVELDTNLGDGMAAGQSHALR